MKEKFEVELLEVVLRNSFNSISFNNGTFSCTKQQAKRKKKGITSIFSQVYFHLTNTNYKIKKNKHKLKGKKGITSFSPRCIFIYQTQITK